MQNQHSLIYGPLMQNLKRNILTLFAAIAVASLLGGCGMFGGDTVDETKGWSVQKLYAEARVELEKLMDAKVFIEIWVKVRSGWADDEARVRSFGYQ